MQNWKRPRETDVTVRVTQPQSGYLFNSTVDSSRTSSRKQNTGYCRHKSLRRSNFIFRRMRCKQTLMHPIFASSRIQTCCKLRIACIKLTLVKLPKCTLTYRCYIVSQTIGIGVHIKPCLLFTVRASSVEFPVTILCCHLSPLKGAS